MLEELKEKVLEANLMLPKYGLVTFTWGNVSAYDKESGLVVIKPSGVGYGIMKKGDMVVTDLEGNVVEGRLKPSSDLMTHLEIYKNLPGVYGVVHTHSSWATSWAQAGKDIPALGTTHADNFYGDIPCTRKMTPEEIKEDYEKNTGKVITETLKERNIDHLAIPAVLVHSHGPFTWGPDCFKAVENSVVLEEISKTAFVTLQLDPNARIQQELLDRHYLRKHGKDAYYGQ